MKFKRKSSIKSILDKTQLSFILFWYETQLCFVLWGKKSNSVLQMYCPHLFWI